MANPSSEASNSLPTPNPYSGYKWTYFTSLDGPLRSRAERFLTTVDWPALLAYAAESRNEIAAVLLSDIGLGYNHMVRILEFGDGKRLVARLRMPPLHDKIVSDDIVATIINCEMNAMFLVRQKTDVPVPQIHAFETTSHNAVKAPFTLMDCLDGNVGMDLGMQVPVKHQKPLFKSLAKIHVQLSAVQLPKIGTIVSINEDGTYQQGPIPGIGGPFDTATEFFKAWAANTEFGMPEEKLRAASGPYAEEILPSVSLFTKSITKIAERLSVRDKGPFPLCHGDFGHNNIIVDDEYRILGVIDWEGAFAGPWELFGDFPLTLQVIPPAMDLPSNYGEDGIPEDDSLKQKFTDQKEYVRVIRDEPESLGAHVLLSEIIGNFKRQQLITAMRLYQDGKVGWYSKLIDQFST
ncbi:hypothetical protein LHYA1_G006488 [Lachnellula hyalina]|uniref:Aminoglycoside phosphotransferase domain-containing protein n=1 Tax=Lachnellula hyalina TaxID=1316788 RepID=A0A8H8TY97_9HELO|nr:uncharacterized protein LHYA1_G006488 [Lachnellula hyalina]TVY25150.1 hypothetical protein LHYA1_G006488 [Lachnellula hyalina]